MLVIRINKENGRLYAAARSYSDSRLRTTIYRKAARIEISTDSRSGAGVSLK